MYKYKKGWSVNKGKPSFCYAISSGKLESYLGGLSKEIIETNNLNDYIEFCLKENAKKIVLVDINQEDFDYILEALSHIIEEIEINYCNTKSINNYSKLEKCNKLINVLIYGHRLTVKLWATSNNQLLERLEIIGVNRLLNQDGLKSSSVKELIIKNRNSNLNDTKSPVIKDFSIFETMPNLKILDLFIGKKVDKTNDLISLSKLKNIESITLPKNYFYFDQYAWLSSKLKNVKGIGCIKIERWNKRIEKNEYTINGVWMPWEFKDYYGDGINKYLEKFNDLVDKFSKIDMPPQHNK